MLPETLVGLALLINSGETVDQNTINQMNSAEVQIVQDLANSDNCIPENIESLLKQTEQKLKEANVDAQARAMMPAPTSESF